MVDLNRKNILPVKFSWSTLCLYSIFQSFAYSRQKTKYIIVAELPGWVDTTLRLPKLRIIRPPPSFSEHLSGPPMGG